MPSCPNCGQDNPERAKFCLECGEPLATAEAPLEERKLVTVLFTDIVGSTAHAERLDPEDVRARLSVYYDRVRTELERFGGTVEKFIGDAVVALFGAPVAHEDDPERAVRAAFALRDAVAELNAADAWLELRIRTAVHTGEALVVTGGRSSAEGMAAGDVMNTAARLQSAAPVDGILVGELTYLATRSSIEYRAAEPVLAKGKSEPVIAWEAVAPLERPAAARSSRGRLVGRDEELGRLEALWEETLERRRPALAIVLGPPGIGKSRLLDELRQRVSRAATVLEGRCLSYGEGITYWPVIEILQGAAGVRQSDDAATSSRRLGELLEALPTDDPAELRTLATAAANLLGIPASPQGTYETTEISRAELHWGLRRLLHLLARRTPLVIVVEDLHWAEPTLLELLATLAEGEDGAPLLVIGSGRPELAERDGLWRDAPHRAVIRLEPLRPELGRALLGELLGSAALVDDASAEAILGRAGGNPLFLEETVRMLSEAGLVDETGWHLSGEGAELAVPTSLQTLLASRLDGLPQPEKRVAQQASVAGLVFWAGAVAHMRGADRAELGEVQQRLDGLERRDVVRASEQSTMVGEREYAFKHVLLREVAYGQLPKGRRAELHLRFAEWLESLGGVEEFVEIVAYHLEQSCRMAREVERSPVPPPLERAAAALMQAGDRAERREGMREAARFYERALELPGESDPAARLELRLRHARALAALGQIAAAAEAARATAEEALRLERPDLRASALILDANLDLRRGRATEARRALGEAVELAEACGDRRLQLRAWFARAALLAEIEGDLEGAVTQLRLSLTLAEELDDRALHTEGRLRLGFVLFNLGKLAEAETELDRCLALAAELGSRRDEARAIFQLGLVKYLRGDLAEAERLGREAQIALEVTGEPYFQIQNHVALAQYALARGDPGRAEEWLRAAMPTALDEGGWLLVEAYRLLVQVLVELGRADDAADLVEFAARDVPEEHSYARAALILARAYVASARGEDEARRLYEDALELLQSLGLPIEVCQARMSYALVLAALGEEDEARRQLDEARGTCAGIGAAGLGEEIERRLATLAVGPVEPAPPRSVV